MDAERRLRLYLKIARRLRKLGPETKGARHAAVQQAWDARREMFAQDVRSLMAEVVVGIGRAQVREAAGWVVLVIDLESGEPNGVYGDFASPEQAFTWAAEHDADPNGGRVVDGDQPGWSHTVLPRFEVRS